MRSRFPGEPYCEVIAPNLDRFRRQNFSMECCLSNYPLCSPHRGILMTGVWPYQNGVIKNWIELETRYQSLGQTFDAAGYHTAYVGKWHLAGPGFDKQFVPPGPHRQGFQDWHVWGAVDQHMDKSFTFDPNTGAVIHPMGYNATLQTDQAVDILKQRQGSDKPWMMIVSWHPPHFPLDDAPPADEATYKDKKLTLRPNVAPGHGKGALVSEETLQIAQRGYYAHITAIDREFGRLLKTLDETGQADNTIVVFTSDHGEMMGSHGRMHKRAPHEESIRVPFFVRYPGVTRPGSSSVLFSSIDLYPTVCGLAGLEIPPHCEGSDFSAILRGKPGPSPDHVFLMNDGGGLDEGDEGLPPPRWRGIRTRSHTYAVALNGRWLLFDNQHDPLQQNNLIDDPAHAPMIAAFDKLIQDWLTHSSDTFAYSDAITKRSSHPA